ncbi:MAG: flavodoxin-dependent (E)-4-hydroxy-3-methylbut-2-enyl-diphosphate synthase [Spirochaetes bacterium]|nr:flavodoxin-dependent (E)-4-hydroxy-3-methylbut-2-enyl-diphosphate synthase [Spirochaetota bacterium]
MKRKKTRAVRVGKIIIGGNFPVSVQTMWKKPLSCADKKILPELIKLQDIGCDIIRFAVPDMQAAEFVGNLSKKTELPVVADIHFDYKIALRVLDFPVAKVRINPGNIGKESGVVEVIKKSTDKGIPLRIGVNAGSLPRNLQNEKDSALAMVKAAESELNILEKYSFKNVIFSLKSSDVTSTIRANRLFSERFDFPLHIGVTEAGPLIPGIVKNSFALTTLLKEGIGDTIRVSLSSEPEDEVLTGKEILKTAGVSAGGIDIVSCPMCSRSVFDVKVFVTNLYKNIHTIKKDVTIAVMGCPVNGPGEAKSADIGIAGAGKYAVLFKKGSVIKSVKIEDAPDIFLEEINKF